MMWEKIAGVACMDDKIGSVIVLPSVILFEPNS
jgi:hypothetical protein